MTGFAELDLAARVAVARARLAPLAIQLGGILTLEDTSGVTTLEARAADDDDGLFLMIRAAAPSCRAVRLFGHLVDRSHASGAYGVEPCATVILAVEVDNRVGDLALVQILDDDDPPDPALHQLAARATYVSSVDAADRTQMLRRLDRLPALVGAVDAFLRTHDSYALRIREAVEVTLAFLDDEDPEWAANTAALDARIAALDAIATLIETVPPESFVACRFCTGRFMPGPSARCPHCGAPL